VITVSTCHTFLRTPYSIVGDKSLSIVKDVTLIEKYRSTVRLIQLWLVESSAFRAGAQRYGVPAPLLTVTH
jgi:hypothetical protein